MNDELNKDLEEGNDQDQIQDENANENTSSELENELDELNDKLSEANDKFLRLYAEFDNYKRRTMKEKAELLQTAGKDVMLSLLPVIDDFERAHKSESSPDFESYKKGIELIHQKFGNILKAKGVEAVESIGKPFDVDLHEAITNIPAPSEDLVGKVIDETEKGYMMNGHVIRFAKVIVGE
jgi:molecular chaperone GrpE